MNSISFDVVKSMIHQKKYDAITEFAHVEFPDKGELVVTEYTGTGVRVYKDSEDRTRILCPKEMDVIQEGTVANEIAANVTKIISFKIISSPFCVMICLNQLSYFFF